MTSARGQIERVLDAAKAKDLRTGDNPPMLFLHLGSHKFGHLLCEVRRIAHGILPRDSRGQGQL